ncbi:hypothetical protein AXI76_gp203 [Pseudoalteromonas phage H101]|uniref:Uncharacterized protein n=1 Tax=Pseudoalteromonas phage H101 TaxID=1654919 RepID=A0A0H4INE0_9CAUD|nr:hypothetical protein AXI76_gp203 [Pseudoalteromonas phage H101]AKO61104.1 hypothetical protein [Pseudoalteromonas phage H101]
MKYNSDSLDKAIDLILPNIAKAKSEGIVFNRPSLLDMVAKEFFIKSLDSSWNPSYDERVAYFICQEASYDLSLKGMMDFGTMQFNIGG